MAQFHIKLIFFVCFGYTYLLFNDYNLLINWRLSFFHIHYIIEVWIKFLSQWISDTSEKRSFWKDQYCPATCIGICKTWVVLQKPESEIWSFLLQANLFGWQFWQISRLISFFMTLKVRKLLQVVSSSGQDIKVVKSTIKVGHLLSNLRRNSDSISKFRLDSDTLLVTLLSKIRHTNSTQNSDANSIV